MKNKKKKPYTIRWYSKRKRRSYSNRDFNDPVYAKWREDVKKRDNYTCQWPECGRTTGLQVHHIRKWSTHPALRFLISNGITLCTRCHNMIKGKEEHYEGFFISLLEQQMIDRIQDFKGRKNGS